MYRYTFSFALKLITALLQKLAIFYIWNIKQKDDEMDKACQSVGKLKKKK